MDEDKALLANAKALFRDGRLEESEVAFARLTASTNLAAVFAAWA